jgi:hypothetical protein
MADVLIEGLSGVEIIEDVLAQIKRKLMYSCDLRNTDSYGQGYSGTIEIHLKLHSMDNTPVDIVVNIPPKAEPPVSTDEVTVTPLEVVEKIEISQELDLESVRERIKEPEPLPPSEEEEESRMPSRLKRKYTRRNALEVPEMGGGAVDLDEKF